MAVMLAVMSFLPTATAIVPLYSMVWGNSSTMRGREGARA